MTSSFKDFGKQHISVILSALVTISVAILYLSIAPTRLTNANFGGDGGDFLAAILTRGIPHPTGYPTYVLLGILFQFIPISTAVFRGALESLVPAAIGAGLLTGWMIYVLRSRNFATYTAATATGVSWGVAPLLFSQAVIVEVHGLQTLFVVLLLWWMVLNLRIDEAGNKKWVVGLSLLAGVGGGNHVTIGLMIPAVLFVLIYTFRHTRSVTWIVGEMGVMLTGLLVYLYLPLRAQAYPAINWGNPQTWQGFLWEVTAGPYRGLLFGAPQPVLWERIRSVFSLLMDQYGAIGLVAGVIGAIQFSFKQKWLRMLLLWIFVVYFVFAIGYNTQDSVGYLLPAILVFSIWIGLVIARVWDVGWKRVPIGILLSLIVMASMVVRVPGTRSRVDPRYQDQPARFTELLLQDAPRNAMVYTLADQDTFPLWYYHFGLRERPDLRIVVLPLTQFVWYQQSLEHTYADLNFPTIYTEDQPNTDWGYDLGRLNPNRVVCNALLNAEDETKTVLQCNQD